MLPLSIYSCVKFFESNYIIVQFLYMYFMAHIWEKEAKQNKITFEIFTYNLVQLGFFLLRADISEEYTHLSIFWLN